MTAFLFFSVLHQVSLSSLATHYFSVLDRDGRVNHLTAPCPVMVMVM